MKSIIAIRKVRRLQKILSTLTPEMLYRLEQDLPATVRRAKFKAVRGRKSENSDNSNRPKLRAIAGGKR
jgi:hypothetical protein